jgi:predicted RNA binding protein YcfA (HicA-like mRNA interferase family)
MRLFMPKLKPLSGAETVRALERLGFVQARQRGSHVVLKKQTPEGAIGCSVPLHRELAIGTLRGILRQIKVEPDEFMAIL